MKTAREYVDDTIRYRESLGYSESTYRVLRNSFLPYIEAGNADGNITEGLLDSWCLRRKSENDNGYIRRMSAIRSFINYLDARGEYSYGFDEYAIPRSGRRYTPYIFSDAELLERLKAFSVEMKEEVEAKAAKLDEIGYKAYEAQMKK